MNDTSLHTFSFEGINRSSGSSHYFLNRGFQLSACARIVPCLVWRGDPDTLTRACPDSGLNAWDERGTSVVRARAWPGHVAGLKTPVSRYLRSLHINK
ncbi:hypothetical protein PBY51_007608 [Eleginops maclovinus]|uniref:Uncharacterized protein n=1 Tax=Eleginops maclovinus TaxID=56733 RepID=A0AAN7X5K8_ELEMC|nr:hypothetical protein PBY51_007608 [Eleginops maclovinus]